MRNIVSPLDGIRSPFGPRYGTSFSPASLFAAGEQGVWYDPSDFSTMFQDSAGTTPVTAVEQPVGRILDKSGRGNHATQTTTASRPVLSARVNQLTYSEQFDNAAWTKAGTSVTANTSTAPDGTTTADKATPDTNSSTKRVGQVVSATGTSTWSFSFYAKADGYSRIGIWDYATTGAYASFLLSGAGTVLDSGVGAAGATISSEGSGWYRCSFRASITGSVGFGIQILPDSYVSGGISSPWTGNGTSGIYIWGADLRPTNQTTLLPAYQRIAAATDYDTTGFPYYLRFDGTDDSMATGTITPGIDKAQVFAGVRKQSDAATNTFVELGTNSATVAGTLGLFSAVNGYRFRSIGTIAVDPNTASYPPPITNILTGLGDISGDLATLRVNGAQIVQSTADQGTGNYLAYPLYIGARAGSSLRFNGNIYSLILRFGANLDATTISNTETWVNGKTMAY